MKNQNTTTLIKFEVKLPQSLGEQLTRLAPNPHD